MNYKEQSARLFTKLNSIAERNVDKCSYELARYYHKCAFGRPSFNLRDSVDVDIMNTYFYYVDDSLPLPPAFNVIKSVIDSIVAQIANQKVRPYFTPVDGTYNTRRSVKEAQKYFDILYDKQNVQEKIVKAFRNAAIFGRGYIYVDTLSNDIKPLDSWNVALLESEDIKTKLLIKYWNYPTSNLDGYKGNKDYVTYSRYYDLATKKMIEYCDGEILKTHSYNHDRLPIIELNYTLPISGRTISIVEELNGIQGHIDLLLGDKIAKAEALTPANTTYVIEGSNLDESLLDSETGKVYPVAMPSGVNAPPVVNVAPTPFDPLWTKQLDYYIDQAYSLVGVSQLSAQSKKPAGVESGIAIQTLEDVESDRFETQIRSFTSAFIKLACLLIDIEDPNESITSDTEVKWKTLQNESKNFKIQFSAASSLSNDPSEKIKQVQFLLQNQFIDPSYASTLLDMPDIQLGYSMSQAKKDAVDNFIYSVIEYGNEEMPDYLDLDILNTTLNDEMNKLYGSFGTDKKVNKILIEQLTKLQKVADKVGELINPETEEQGKVTEDEVKDIATSPNNNDANDPVNLYDEQSPVVN